MTWGEDWLRFVGGSYSDPQWDHARPVLLDLLPPPGRLTIDLGCGEGRLARELKALGHRVIGVDIAPVLVERARQLDPSGRYVIADAASLPLADGSADLVVAYMSLIEMEDLEGVLLEAARVLVPGGRLGFVALHPFETATDSGAAPCVEAAYSQTRVNEDVLGDVVFRSLHRPLEAYSGALERSGFVIEAVREPRVPDRPRRWHLLPVALVVRAVKAR